jgi:pentatricopeptide repeat protein
MSAYYLAARRTISLSTAQPLQATGDDCEQGEAGGDPAQTSTAAASTSRIPLDDGSLKSHRLSRILRRQELLSELKGLVHSSALGVSGEHVQAIRQTAKSLGLFTDQEVIMYIARAFIKTGRCRNAKRLLGEARNELHKTNRGLAANTFAFTLSGIWSEGWHMDRDAWESVLGITNMALRCLPDDEVPVDVFNARIKAWIQLKRFDQLSQALSSIPNPDEVTYNLLIKGFLRNRDQNSATSTMRTMFEHGHRPDIGTFRAIFSGYRNLGLHEDLNARLHSDTDSLDLGSDTAILNSMISLYVRAKDLWSAFEVAGRMGVEPPPSLFLEPRPSWSPSATQSDPISLPDSMRGGDEVKYDTKTFAILISACARIGRPDVGLELFDDFKMRSARATRLGDVPLLANVSLATSLLMCFLGVGDVAKADAVIDELVAGRSLLGVVLARGSMPNVVVFNALLSGRLQRDGFTAAPQVIKRMYEARVWPDDRTLSIITAHLSRESSIQLDELSLTIPQIVRSFPGSVHFDIYGFNHVLARIINDYRRVKSKAGWAPLRVSSNSGPSTAKSTSDELYPHSRYLRAMRSSLLDRQNLPDAWTAQALMGLHADRGGTPEALWSLLRKSTIDRGLRPTPGQITAVMRGFCDAGDPVSARRAMSLAEAFGIPPNPIYYTVLINGFVERDDLHSAFATFAEMRRKGVGPDPVTLLCLAKGCARDGDIRRVEALAADALALTSSTAAAGEPGSSTKNSVGYVRSVVATALYRAHMVNGDFVKAQQALASFLEHGSETNSNGDLVHGPDAWKQRQVPLLFMAVVKRSGKQLRSFLHRTLNRRGNTEVLEEALRLQADSWAECKRRRAEARLRLVEALAQLQQIGLPLRRLTFSSAPSGEAGQMTTTTTTTAAVVATRSRPFGRIASVGLRG